MSNHGDRRGPPETQQEANRLARPLQRHETDANPPPGVGAPTAQLGRVGDPAAYRPRWAPAAVPKQGASGRINRGLHDERGAEKSWPRGVAAPHLGTTGRDRRLTKPRSGSKRRPMKYPMPPNPSTTPASTCSGILLCSRRYPTTGLYFENEK